MTKNAIQGKKILVIDDDPSNCRLVEMMFSGQGATVFKAYDGVEGLRALYDYRPDLVVLDIMMPGLDGWHVCQQIRQLADVPVIILSAMGDNEDIVRGLDFGADDYVPKPFNSKVLLARARAALRRVDMGAGKEETSFYTDGHLTIDLAKRHVMVNQEAINLSATEFKLLAYLFRNAGRVRTFEQILNNVWGEEYQSSADYVHVYMWRLRQKIEPEPKEPIYFHTQHSVGYRFEKGVPERR